MKGRGIICSQGAAWVEQRQWLSAAMKTILKGGAAFRPV
jgi:hypothetical protein